MFKYPILMRSLVDGVIVRFDALTGGKVISVPPTSALRVGSMLNFPPHTDGYIWQSCLTSPPIPEGITHEIQDLIRSIPPHPLLNDESKHYEMVGGVEAITLMEAMFTVEELKAWAKLSAMKYRLRIGDKDTPEKEIKKIKTYESYYRYLESK